VARRYLNQRYKEGIHKKKKERLSVKQQAVILEEAEAGALAHLQGPIYVYRGPVNYPTREMHS
jgi:hypothetical protein